MTTSPPPVRTLNAPIRRSRAAGAGHRPLTALLLGGLLLGTLGPGLSVAAAQGVPAADSPAPTLGAGLPLLAQTDPFLRSAPPVQRPSLAPSVPVSSAGVSAPPVPLLPGAAADSGASSLPTFGQPRVSSEGGRTRVAFDLRPGVSYTLIPSYSGLRIDVRGAALRPARVARLGGVVGEYTLTPLVGGQTVSGQTVGGQAAGGSAVLSTPYPLGLREGWRASETLVASGGRVLLLEFGGSLVGGADASVRGAVQLVGTTPAATQAGTIRMGAQTAPQAQPDTALTATASGPVTVNGAGTAGDAGALITPVPFSPAPSAYGSLPGGYGFQGGAQGGNVQGGYSPYTAPVTALPAGAIPTSSVSTAPVTSLPTPASAVPVGMPVTPGDLPPGDTVTPTSAAALLTPTPALTPDSTPQKITSGVVAGTVAPGQAITAPRIGKNPGLTRVVLDLPAGTGFRVTLLPLGLRVDLSGVTAASSSSQAAPQGSARLTPEVRAWQTSPTLSGSSVTITTATPLSPRSGWRSALLAPVPGSARSRLVLDFSPALADTSPLENQQVARLVSSRPGRLAFSGSPNRPKVVLDPGHGGTDPGAIGTVVEKQVTLAVALKVRADLEAAGIDVLMTRDSDRPLSSDKVTDLALRAALGTGVAQLFVSIHVNSTEPRNALNGYGIETWFNRNNPNSPALAATLQRDVIGSTAAYSRGLMSGRSLAVLRQSRIPAALIEIGYTSHPVDGQNLKDQNYLDRVAFGVASGIRDALVGGLGVDWQ